MCPAHHLWLVWAEQLVWEYSIVLTGLVRIYMVAGGFGIDIDAGTEAGERPLVRLCAPKGKAHALASLEGCVCKHERGRQNGSGWRNSWDT